MTTKKSNEASIPANNECHSHEDLRRRAKQRLLTSPYGESENFDPLKPKPTYGKVHQVQFKITPFAQKVGEEAAALFGLSLSQYCKAVFYFNLGLVSEPLDRRRKADRLRPRL